MSVKAKTVRKSATNGQPKKTATNGNSIETAKVVKATQNGNGKTTESVKAVEVVKIAQPQKPKLSLAEKIESIKLLDGLTNKRERVVKTLSELKHFQFSADDSCQLKLTDISGRAFKTSNSNLLSLVTNNLQSLLEDKVSELDTKIMDFEL